MFHLQSIPFPDMVSSKISFGNICIVFIKVRYDYNNFFMAGNQFGFNYSSNDKIDNLLQIVNNRLENALEAYNISDDSILYVQLTLKPMDTKLLSEFMLFYKPRHITKEESMVTNKNLNIPLSIKKDSLGKHLTVEQDNGLITNIILIHNKVIINFLETIRDKAKFLSINHKDNITNFNGDYKFYLLKDKSGDFVLAVRIVNAFSIEKIRYSLNGVVINH